MCVCTRVYKMLYKYVHTNVFTACSKFNTNPIRNVPNKKSTCISYRVLRVSLWKQIEEDSCVNLQVVLPAFESSARFCHKVRCLEILAVSFRALR